MTQAIATALNVTRSDSPMISIRSESQPRISPSARASASQNPSIPVLSTIRKKIHQKTVKCTIGWQATKKGAGSSGALEFARVENLCQTASRVERFFHQKIN